MAVNKEKQYFESKGMETTAFYPQQLFSSFDRIVRSKKRFMFLSNMNADNREYFKSEIGKQDFIMHDSGNRKLHCYRVEFNNGTMWMLTAREKGTCYEYLVSGNEKKLRKEIKKYLKELFKNRED